MDLSHLLYNNDPPEPSEIPAISASLVDLLLQQRRLQLQMDEIEEKVEQHLAVLSAVRRIPLEILSEIFIMAVFGTNRRDYTPSRVTYPDTRERVVALGLVCRDWRRATLLTHVFWSHVAVDCPLRGRLWSDLSYDKVGAWFSRQDALPRTLEIGSKYLGATCCDGNSECRYQNTGLGRLLVEGPVLDKLILRLDSPECLQGLFDSFPEPVEGWNNVEESVGSCPWPSFRKLNSIKLHFESWISDPDTITSHSSFDSLPPVTNLQLYLPLQKDAFEGEWEGFDECDEAELNIPRAILEGLKTFTYSCNWTLRHTTGPLAHCHNLETLVLNFDDHSSQCIDPLPTTSPLIDRLSIYGITLPKLRTLRVKKCKWQDTIEYLKFFRAPGLEALDIELDNDGDTWITKERVALWWTPLVGRIKCLRTLCLRDMVIDMAAFAAMNIRELPGLTHLTLEWIDSLEDHFGGTGVFSDAPTRSKGRPFRALQSLELLNLDEGFDFKLVIDFLRDRRSHRIDVVDGKEEVVFEGPPDSITSVVAMYSELDVGFAEKADFYGMARVLTGAGVAVKIGGPPKPPPKKSQHNPFGRRQI